MEMLNSLPALGIYVLHDSLWCLIDADANDADFVSPSFPMVSKHFLVVCHWCLARRAPCCPEIDKEDLALLVFNCSLLLSVDFVHFLDGNERSTNSNLDFNLDVGCLWVDPIKNS